MNGDQPRSTTGIPGLDEVLDGGLLPHRLYLVDGSPGAGKTTFALQYLLEGVRRGEPGLYVTLSETKLELESGARSHGWSLEGIDVIELIADSEDLDGDEQLTMLPPSEVELSETTRRVLEAVERFHPARMVFDSLSELRLLAQNSLRYRRQILALKQFFIGRNCTVIMLDDRTAEGPDLQLHSIAHGVIALEARVPTYGEVRRELRVQKFRGSNFTSGYHDFSIRRGGLRAYPRLAAARPRNGAALEIIPSGVAALDTLLGGGIERGTSTLLVGAPGSGKSTLALQYAAAAAQRGEHAAAFAFDESISAMLARLSGLGMMIRSGTGPGEVALQQIDPVAVSPGEFSHLIRSSVAANGARVVIIDSLNGYLNSMPHNDYLIAQLHELLSFLNRCGVATFLIVAQSGVIGINMSAPVDASYLADTVLLLRYFEHAGSVKKAISVLKKRTGGHEDSIRQLWFDPRGIHLSEPLLNLRGVLTGVPTDLAPARDPDLAAACDPSLAAARDPSPRGPTPRDPGRTAGIGPES
jgi:circadian clock protein KaiC